MVSKLIIIVLSLAFISAFSTEFNGEQHKVDIPQRGMTSNNPAEKWEDALVSGNGIMGAMVIGDPFDERIILTSEKLYEPLYPEVINENISDLLPQIRHMIKDGKYNDASVFCFEKMGHPRLFTDPFHPAFALTYNNVYKTYLTGKIENDLRLVSFETGEAIVRWNNNRGLVERKLFVWQADNVVIWLLSNTEIERTKMLQYGRTGDASQCEKCFY